MNDMRSIEVVYSPRLFSNITTKKPYVVVVTDVFRATTSICAALDYGVKAIIPVKRIRHARFLKRLGYLVAAERGGNKVKFADLDNSALSFFDPRFKGKEIVYSTTNGTKAIRLASSEANRVAVGSFVNIEALSKWIIRQDQNVVILCAGWKNKVNMEDSLFSGALSMMLLQSDKYKTDCDAAKMAMDQWKLAKNDIQGYIARSSHRNRLRHLVSDEVLEYTFKLNSSRIVPVLKGYKIIPAQD